TRIKAASIATEKCLHAVREKVITVSEGVDISVSFSAGVAAFDELEEGLSTTAAVDTLLAIADRRLYQAKESGRAQVVSLG
ncbi:MAG: GGDEF domain-containing protein, partial [Ghiorsea sp.]